MNGRLPVMPHSTLVDGPVDADGDTAEPAKGMTRRAVLRAGACLAGLTPAAMAQAAPAVPLWGFGLAAASAERQQGLEDASPPRVVIANTPERHRLRGKREHGATCLLVDQVTTNEARHWDAELPPLRLDILAEEFAPDYLALYGVQIASRRLREAMALGPETVAWRSVEPGRMHAAARAQDYRQMRLRVMLDVIDPARADFEAKVIGCPDGRSTTVRFARRIYWRPAIVPPVELFFARHTNLIVAIDALATRVLRTGITDVAFYDQQRMQELYDRGERPGTLIVKTL